MRKLQSLIAVGMEFLLVFVCYPIPTFPSIYHQFSSLPNMRKDSPKHFLNCNMSTSVTHQVVEVEEEEEELQSSSLLQHPLNGDGPTAATAKKKRNLPGNPDPDAEVVALSPRTLMATNRYMCEVCHKGFQRDQNLQLHRRGHNLPWKLKQRTSAQIKKKVYICPETSCVHHDPSRALGDLTGIKKHYCRKHGEKKWKCDKCSKCYAVQSDWKAHAKICGTKEYRCDCGTIFSRRDSFITHRAFCDALTEENNKMQQQQSLYSIGGMLDNQSQQLGPPSMPTSNPISTPNTSMNLTLSNQIMNSPSSSYSTPSAFSFPDNPCASSERAASIQNNGCNSAGLAVGSSYMSATALLQKAAVMGAMISDNSISPVLLRGFAGHMSSIGPHGSVQDRTDASSGKSSQYGLLDSHLLVQQENIDFGNHLEGVFMDGVQSGGECDRTVDFLGLGPSGHLDISDRSFNNNTIGLGYSDEQQNLHNMNSYHYISNDPTALEKSMWNF